MTLNDRQILLKDLSGRLAYDVRIHIDIPEENKTIDSEELDVMWLAILESNNPYHIIKPYLRPMSSMSEEEISQLDELGWCFDERLNHIDNRVDKYNCNLYVTEKRIVKLLDWIYSHHFDVNGLIDKGLAIMAPEGMYPKQCELPLN